MSTTADEAATGPASAVPRRAYLGTLVAACSAVFVAQASSSIPSTLNGLFQSDLGATGDQITWITAAFMIAVVVFEFTFGVLGDLFGRKKLVIAGTAVLLVGNIVCATATQPHALWIGAGLMGLGAGAMLPGSLSLAAAVTRTSRTRAKAVAIWAGFLSAGGGAAPLIGGLFAHYGSWRGAFWILGVLAALSIVLMLLFAAESSAPEGRKLDIPGQITFAVGLILILFAAVQGPADGWGNPRIVTCFAVGTLFLAAFVLIENRSESPILHLDLFKNRAFTVTSIAAVIGMFSFLGVGYTISMWMGPTQHQDPLRIAVVFMILQAPTFVLIPVMSRLLRRMSATLMLSSGFALMAVGSLCYTTLDVTDNRLAPFVLPSVVIGLGFALSLNSITAVALNTVPMHLAGMASATNNMIRDLGFSLGPVVIGAVALSQAGDQLMAELPGSGLPADQITAATGIAELGGPVAVNGILPGQPGSAAHALALGSLGSGLTLGFIVCGIAATAAAVLTVLGMGRTRPAEPTGESLSDPLQPALEAIPDVNLMNPIARREPEPRLTTD
ncbi:MFS transporter [Streptomyces sp. NPDC052043]|uniref:MFS transporter n=1 Tax=Streptomyces sp. NPDC052043 TaxID=3365684 RepID=UPI0037D51508